MISFQDNLYLTDGRILVVFLNLHGFVIWICQYFYPIATCDRSIQSTWSCYWLDQIRTLALNTWILSKFSTFTGFVYYLFCLF